MLFTLRSLPALTIGYGDLTPRHFSSRLLAVFIGSRRQSCSPALLQRLASKRSRRPKPIMMIGNRCRLRHQATIVILCYEFQP